MEKDFLDGWREETRVYEGGCEYDATAEAIKQYLLQEELENKEDKEDQFFVGLIEKQN